MILIIGGGGISDELKFQLGNDMNRVQRITTKNLNDIQDEVRSISEKYGISTVIVTAGYLEKQSFEYFSFENIDKTIDANLTFPIKIAKIVYPYLNSKGKQFIVFSSSVVFGTRDQYSVYASAKAGLEKFIENLREEAKFDCLIVRNGRTDTKLRWNNYAKNKETTVNLLSVSEVAEAIIDTVDNYSGGKVLDIFKENEKLNISVDRKS